MTKKHEYPHVTERGNMLYYTTYAYQTVDVFRITAIKIADIKNAATLQQLHRALIAFEQFNKQINGDEPPTETALCQCGIDICKLPTFGGSEPTSTLETWSWDETHLLVGVGPFSEWEIVER